MATTAKGAPLAGDDIGASVIDCGSWLVRVGAAGDDTPRALVPSAVGCPEGDAARVAGDRVLLGPCSFRDVAPVYTHAADGAAVVSDWDAMRAVWAAGATAAGVDLAAAPVMIVEPSRPWPDRARARAMETAFEGCSVPAAYLGRGAAMAAFASARTTACVVDAGHQGAVAVPVSDGYVLRKSIVSSVVGGHYLSERLYEFVDDQLRRKGVEGDGAATDPRVPIGAASSRMRALHEVRRKLKPREVSDDKAENGNESESKVVSSRCTVEDLSLVSPQVSFTDAHRTFFRLRLLDDVKCSTFRVSPGGPGSAAAKEGDGGADGDVVMSDAPAGNKSGENSKGNSLNGTNGPGGEASGEAGEDGNGAEKEGKDADREKEREREIEKSKDKERFPSLATTYELPDGNIIDVSRSGSGVRLADALFENDTSGGLTRRALSTMAFDAITACDMDMRRELFGGIVLAGGCSLIPGTKERFTRELAILTPQLFKMKMIASQTSIERTAGPWIGGSIVSSLGTFQQAWVSKQEYDELGAMGCLRKCP